MTRLGRRAALIGTLSVSSALGLAGSGRAATTLRVGVGTAPLSAETKALQEMARLAAERSGGDLKVDVFDSDKLGGSVAQLENLQLGTQDMLSNVADWYQHLDKGWNALAIPFVFGGVDHVKRFQQTATYKGWLAEMPGKHGVRMLADNWYRLPRVLLTTLLSSSGMPAARTASGPAPSGAVRESTTAATVTPAACRSSAVR
jgi:TRAP-type C4-dicarboxylate transport system substrate-binding protein